MSTDVVVLVPRVGRTVGWLALRGWWSCTTCGKGWLGARSREVESWKLAGGGRSVETGVGRIRFDGALDPLELAKRIVRLPELEKECARLRKALADVADGHPRAEAYAKRVLDGGDP